jgi:hypothetical protein
MILIVFHMIQEKDCPLQAIMSMIKMQFVEHISLKVHADNMITSLNQGILEVKIDILVFFGLRGIVGLSIVSARMLHFASYATCSKRRKARARGQAYLLMVVGEIGIGMMHLINMWVASQVFITMLRRDTTYL